MIFSGYNLKQDGGGVAALSRSGYGSIIITRDPIATCGISYIVLLPSKSLLSSTVRVCGAETFGTHPIANRRSSEAYDRASLDKNLAPIK